jgi:hypothetical protein
MSKIKMIGDFEMLISPAIITTIHEWAFLTAIQAVRP